MRCSLTSSSVNVRSAARKRSASVTLASVGGALAVQPDEVLKDPALEARARDISSGLRCLVCQNQSIDDSDAPLARDLRLIVRERLTAGDDDEIRARFGADAILKGRSLR